jgi:predicted site-specific integrase-resolvase
MIATNRSKLKVPQYAEESGVTQNTVLAWIRSGELQAINVARKPGGRPSWRISREAIERFEAARAATPTPVTTRTRRRKSPEVIEFY